MPSTFKWLELADTLNSIAQNGLTFCENEYDRVRYEQIREIVKTILTTHSTITTQEIETVLFAQEGYATPKIDVRAAVFKDEKILLVKEAADQKWSVPGGWAEVNQSPAASIAREVFEETGFEVKVSKLLGVFDKHKHETPPQLPHAYKCFFLCNIVGGQATSSIETLDVQFFAQNALPELSLSRVTAYHIERCFAHYYNPQLLADYE